MTPLEIVLLLIVALLVFGGFATAPHLGFYRHDFGYSLPSIFWVVALIVFVVWLVRRRGAL